METVLADTEIESVKGTVLTGKMQAHNSFEEPDQVTEQIFDNAEVIKEEEKILFRIPACSVLHLEVSVSCSR